MVYRLTLSYRGTAYAGWQRQPNAIAVQQVVEEALGELLGREPAVVGAGRTDAGVHARGQVAHLELGGEVELRALVHGVNHYLPEDVRVLAAGAAGAGFHARKSATAKEYSYRLSRAAVLSPLDSWRTVRVEPGIDLGAMREATALLIGRHDFTAFALAGGAHRQPRRTILAAEWIDREAELELRIVGDGFLRGMVRSIVGTLVEVGRGRRPASGIAALLSGQPRSAAGPTAPARALVLERVDYDVRRSPGGVSGGARAE